MTGNGEELTFRALSSEQVGVRRLGRHGLVLVADDVLGFVLCFLSPGQVLDSESRK
jgi:hypothetical protein